MPSSSPRNLPRLRYMMANLRLVLAVEVAAGNQHTSKHSSPRLWEFLDGLPAELRPWLIRGDAGFGNEPVMREASSAVSPTCSNYG